MGKAINTCCDNLGYFNPPNVYRPAIIDIRIVGEYSAEDGATNTYRITQNDGKIFEFDVKNGSGGSAGRSVTSVEQIQVSTESLGKNVARIRLSDGTYTDVEIRNGAQGEVGPQGQRGPAGIDSVEASIGTNDPTQAPSVDKDLNEGVLSLTFNNIKGEKGDQGEPAVAVENYVTAEATSSTTSATDVLPATGSSDTVYRVSNWDGTQYNTNAYTEYGWYDGAYKMLATRTPGIDDEPTAGSQKLVKSGGVAAQISQLGQEIDSIIEVYGTIDDGNINPTGLVEVDSSTNRNLYFISCQGLAKVIVSDGDMYGFFTAPPAAGSVTSDGIRHLDTLSNTEITIPDGVTYLAVRAATQPTFKLPEDGLKQRTDALEEKTDALEEKTDALDAQVNGEEYGYPGYASLTQIPNINNSYYISEKPSDGKVYAVDVKVGSGSVQILRVNAPILGEQITTEILTTYNIPTDLQNSVVRIPINVTLGENEYVGIQGANAWYFGQAQGYRLYRDGGYADNYTAAIQIIGVGLEQRVSTLEDSRQFDVEKIASDIAMFENIGFCGDSYTAGMIVVSENPTVTAENQNLCWGKIIERTHGVNSFIYALGGTSVVDNKPTNPWYLDNSVCLPKLLSESAKNLYVISLGHNDAYISTYTTKTKTEFLNEFETNYRSIISQVSAHAPNAKIILCKQSGPYMQMGWGADINDKIVAIGQDLGIPVLLPEDDAYLSSNIYVNTMVHNHPVFAGYAGIAKAFDRLFSKATVDYHDYFKGYTGL